MSAQINDFARCANYGYPGFNVMDCGCLREKNKKQKKKTHSCLLNWQIHLRIYPNMCAISSIYVCKQAHTLVRVRMSVCTGVTRGSRFPCGSRVPALCQMRDSSCHMPNPWAVAGTRCQPNKLNGLVANPRWVHQVASFHTPHIYANWESRQGPRPRSASEKASEWLVPGVYYLL